MIKVKVTFAKDVIIDCLLDGFGIEERYGYYILKSIIHESIHIIPVTSQVPQIISIEVV